MKKNLLKIIVVAFGLLIAVNLLVVNASGSSIQIERRDDSENVGALSFDNRAYIIEIGEDGTGYLIQLTAGEREILRTCSVVLIDQTNQKVVQLCNSLDDTSYGTITIKIKNLEGVIVEVTGELSNFFKVNSKVKLNYQ